MIRPIRLVARMADQHDQDLEPVRLEEGRDASHRAGAPLLGHRREVRPDARCRTARPVRHPCPRHRDRRLRHHPSPSGLAPRERHQTRTPFIIDIDSTLPRNPSVGRRAPRSKPAADATAAGPLRRRARGRSRGRPRGPARPSAPPPTRLPARCIWAASRLRDTSRMSAVSSEQGTVVGCGDELGTEPVATRRATCVSGFGLIGGLVITPSRASSGIAQRELERLVGHRPDRHLAAREREAVRLPMAAFRAIVDALGGLDDAACTDAALARIGYRRATGSRALRAIIEEDGRFRSG